MSTVKVLVHGFNHTRAHLDVAAAVFGAADCVDTVWLARRRSHARIRVAGFAGKLIDQDELLAPGRQPSPHGRSWSYDDATYPTLLHLVDREGLAENYHRVDLTLQVTRRNVEALFESVRPDCVVADDVPHALATYVVYLVARARGVPILFWRKGPAPHQRLVCGDVDETLVDVAGRAEPAPASASSRAYVDKLSGSYQQAAPAYVTSKLQRSSFGSNIAHRLKVDTIRALRPSAVESALALAKRQRLRAEYESKARSKFPEGNVVSLFLHLQPERTTVPLGGRFAQQYLAAEVIADSLPHGWCLAVREHPTTFLPGPKLVRSSGFYDALRALPRTELLSLDIDPFEIIDRSRAVATITGTVGLEAAVRGVPVLAFGNATFLGCPGVIDMRRPVTGPQLIEAVRGAVTGADEVLGFLGRFDASGAVEQVSERMAHGATPPDETQDAAWSHEYAEAIRGMLRAATEALPGPGDLDAEASGGEAS